jgi:hypothetical protein
VTCEPTKNSTNLQVQSPLDPLELPVNLMEGDYTGHKQKAAATHTENTKKERRLTERLAREFEGQ